MRKSCCVEELRAKKLCDKKRTAEAGGGRTEGGREGTIKNKNRTQRYGNNTSTTLGSGLRKEMGCPN